VKRLSKGFVSETTKSMDVFDREVETRLGAGQSQEEADELDKTEAAREAHVTPSESEIAKGDAHVKNERGLSADEREARKQLSGNVNEAKWDKAKKAAHDEYNFSEENPRFWKVVQTIYANMT
jgi:hypothetical protein